MKCYAPTACFLAGLFCLLLATPALRGVAVAEDTDPFGATVTDAEEEEAEGSGVFRYRVGGRFGYNSFVESIFEDVNLDIGKNSDVIWGGEFGYLLADNLYATLTVEHYSSPSDAELELSFTPVLIGVQSVFDLENSPVDPYIGGGIGFYFLGDEGIVADQENSPASFDPDDGRLLNTEGDVWFSQDTSFGFHIQVGIEVEVHKRVNLFVEGNFRAFAPNRKFNTYHYPVYAGIRVGLFEEPVAE